MLLFKQRISFDENIILYLVTKYSLALTKNERVSARVKERR